MRTVCVSRVDKSLASPWGNPFPLYVSEYEGKNGMVLSINTGIKISLPEDTKLEFFNTNEAVIIGSYFKEGVLCLLAYIVGLRIINHGEKICEASIVTCNSEGVRFIDTTDGQHLVVGSSNP